MTYVIKNHGSIVTLLRRLANPWTKRHISNKYLTEKAMWRDWSDAKPKSWRGCVNGVSCQDSWRGENGTYVELCTAQTVNLHLKVSCGFREERNYVVSSVPTSTEFTPSNFSKQPHMCCLTGPTEMNKNRNFIWTVQSELHVFHIHKPINITIWFTWLLPLGLKETSHNLNTPHVTE